jgi:hypothetical protein
MEIDEKLNLAQAHEKFAKSLNGKTWDLLGKALRTRDEDELMVLAASASLYHWLQIGTAVNAQRGEWLLARVYTVLEKPHPAMEHALRCLDLTNDNPGEMKDFDVAYAYEAMARAHALRGESGKAKENLDQARGKGQMIADPEDRSIFIGDLECEPWFGLG